MPIPSSIHDTTADAKAVLIELIRAKSPLDRLAETVSASNRVAEQCKNAIRRLNPGISEDEVRLRFIELNYGSKLAKDVQAYLMENDERNSGFD